jgi:hypothetical protein
MEVVDFDAGESLGGIAAGRVVQCTPVSGSDGRVGNAGLEYRRGN